MTDPEVLEQRFPVRVREFSIRRGIRGQGALSPEATGIIRSLEFLSPMTVTVPVVPPKDLLPSG